MEKAKRTSVKLAETHPDGAGNWGLKESCLQEADTTVGRQMTHMPKVKNWHFSKELGKEGRKKGAVRTEQGRPQKPLPDRTDTQPHT